MSSKAKVPVYATRYHDTPRIGGHLMGVGGGIAFVCAEFVKVVVLGNDVLWSDLIIILQIRLRERGSASPDRPKAPAAIILCGRDRRALV